MGVDKTNISKELRDAAGHSAANPFRTDHEFPYKQILIDVADKLKPSNWKEMLKLDMWTEYKLEDSSTEEEIENAINRFVLLILEKELDKLSPTERKKMAARIDEELLNKGVEQQLAGAISGTIISGSVATLAAESAAIALFYEGAFAGIWAAVFGPSTTLLIASGTGIGLIVTLPMIFVLLGNTAYRKTLPATLQLIKIRQRIEAEKKFGE